MFRHYRPNERVKSWVWGAVTDLISALLLAGWLLYGLAPEESTPSFAEDDATLRRFWGAYLSRLLAPVGFLWFWGLAVGTGCTARLLSLPFVVEWLAPASYNMFLFHQPIAEWYYLATRGLWWAYPKNFYWFRCVCRTGRLAQCHVNPPHFADLPVHVLPNQPIPISCAMVGVFHCCCVSCRVFGRDGSLRQ